MVTWSVRLWRISARPTACDSASPAKARTKMTFSQPTAL